MSLDHTIVLELADPSPGWVFDPRAAATEIARLVRMGHPVIAVVGAGAAARSRDRAEAERRGSLIDEHEFAQTLLASSRQAGASVASSLDSAGIPAGVINADKAGPFARGGALDAEPRWLSATAFAKALEAWRVVVVIGGEARSEDRRVVDLGDGGPSLSALFIASRLELPVRLIRGRASIPDATQAGARLLNLPLDEAPERGAGIASREALLFARRYGRSFEVGAAGSDRVAHVGAGPVLFETDVTVEHRPLRIAMLGFGPVGAAVYGKLSEAPGRYEIVGVAPAESGPEGAYPADLYVTDDQHLLDLEPDVLIDMTAGRGASGVVDRALRRGVNVVTGSGSALPSLMDDETLSRRCRSA